MKVGIITEHNVLNYGSVLQAYALQRKIELLGYDSEIIDYQYNLSDSNKPIKNRMLNCISDLLTGFSNSRRQKEFYRFRKQVLKCSSNVLNPKNISKDCPHYDIYCTGSDQVWNPKNGSIDTNFLLSFAPNDSKKISYAASYTVGSIPLELYQTYNRYLSQYSRITVREQSGVRLTKAMSGKDADLVCDPTLLLSQEEWNKFASENTFGLKEGKYILVYLLGYMFNMRPDVYNIIDKVQQELGYTVVYLNGSRYEMIRKKSRVIRGVSPEEFVGLFKNAAFVITDSFHGTAFASIFNKPLFGVVKCLDANDSRLVSLLQKIGAQKSIISYDTIPEFSAKSIYDYMRNDHFYMSFKENSERILKEILY